MKKKEGSKGKKKEEEKKLMKEEKGSGEDIAMKVMSTWLKIFCSKTKKPFLFFFHFLTFLLHFRHFQVGLIGQPLEHAAIGELNGARKETEKERREEM